MGYKLFNFKNKKVSYSKCKGCDGSGFRPSGVVVLGRQILMPCDWCWGKGFIKIKH